MAREELDDILIHLSERNVESAFIIFNFSARRRHISVRRRSVSLTMPIEDSNPRTQANVIGTLATSPYKINISVLDNNVHHP